MNFFQKVAKKLLSMRFGKYFKKAVDFSLAMCYNSQCREHSDTCRYGGIGRRVGLKIRW